MKARLGDDFIVMAETIAKHFPVELRCDHTRHRDKVICDCAIIDLGWHPTVFEAKLAWANHVLKELGVIRD